MKLNKYLFLFVVLIFASSSHNNSIGDVIDSLDGVTVHYNGLAFKNTYGRNTTSDGYNLGLKFQCVEFVKRYYYEYYNHKMPNASGNAKDFFDKKLSDKAFNSKRNLMQYRNVREYAPKKGDLLVYDNHAGNPFGHVAIIAEVGNDYVIIVQQNMGSQSRVKLNLVKYSTYITVADYNVLGWLRKE